MKPIQLAFDINDPDFACFLPENQQDWQDLAWTDFNVHDPGVTLLEAINFALNDHAYICDFPVEDLMQGVSGNAFDSWHSHLQCARYAVTLQDYRQVLADLDGVFNSVVQPVDVALDGEADETQQHLHLLDVFVAVAPGVVGEKRNDINTLEEGACWSQLIKNRALCDYFNPIEDKRCAKIAADIQVTFKDGQDTDENQKLIERVMINALLPPFLTPPFHQQKQARQAATSQKDEYAIDTGCSRDTNNQESCFRDNIVVGELYAAVQQLSCVHAVSALAIKLLSSNGLDSNESADYHSSLLQFDKPMFSQLAQLSINGENRYLPGSTIAHQTTELTTSDTENKSDENQIKNSGAYQQLSDFNSLQLSFPPNYQLGNHLATEAEERAESTTFRKLLFVMDQVRASRGAQLAHLSELFAIQSLNVEPLKARCLLQHELYRDLPDTPWPECHNGHHAETQSPPEIHSELMEQRLNFLLALHGEYDIRPLASADQQVRHALKLEYLKLLHYGVVNEYDRPYRDGLSPIFLARVLLLLQEAIRIRLKGTGVCDVVILEHFLLAPVWADVDPTKSLNFEVSVFLFYGEDTSGTETFHTSDDIKTQIRELILNLLPAHIRSHILFRPESHKQNLIDLLKAAYPKRARFNPVTHLQNTQQKASMQKLLNEWVLNTTSAGIGNAASQYAFAQDSVPANSQGNLEEKGH